MSSLDTTMQGRHGGWYFRGEKPTSTKIKLKGISRNTDSGKTLWAKITSQTPATAWVSHHPQPSHSPSSPYHEGLSKTCPERLYLKPQISPLSPPSSFILLQSTSHHGMYYTFYSFITCLYQNVSYVRGWKLLFLSVLFPIVVVLATGCMQEVFAEWMEVWI